MFKIDQIRSAENYWRRRHGQAWCDNYAASIDGVHRDVLLEASARVRPFQTVVDLGCNCGVLTPILVSTEPDVMVTGIDVNAGAKADARRRYPTHHWMEGSIIDVLPLLPPTDIVVSSSCLEHVAPRDIADTMRSIAAIAKKA